MPGNADLDGVHDLGTIVAALREDPVLVTTSMGVGHTADIDATLTELAAQVAARYDTQVYVALVDRPDGLSSSRPEQDLPRQLHQALGEDGIYIAAYPDGYVNDEGYGAVKDDYVSISLARYDQVSSYRGPDDVLVSDAGQVAAMLSIAVSDDLRLSPDAREEFLRSDAWTTQAHDRYGDEPRAPATEGDLIVVGTTVALLVTLCAWTALRLRVLAATPGARRRRTDRAEAVAKAGRTRRTDAERVQRDALDALDRLTARLARAKPGARGSEQAIGFRTAAERYVESRDTLDLVGVLVLARSGVRALDRPEGERYRACFFNPGHGGASRTVTADAGGTGVEVPCCAACGDAGPRAAVRDPLLDGTRPYWEGTSVWAATGYGAFDDRWWETVLAGGRR